MNIAIMLHPKSGRVARLLGAAFVLLSGLLFTGAAAADDQGHNQLQSITAQKLAGDRVQLALQLAGAPQQPLTFTVNQPARIALDLLDTRLSLKDRKTDVGTGAVNSVIAAEAGGRARIVINLNTLVPYATRVQGNTVYVIVGSNPGDTAVAQANVTNFGPETNGTPTPAAAAPQVAATPVPTPPVAAPAPTPSALAPATAPAAAPSVVPSPGGNQIAAVDFKRGPDGSGEVLVTLPNPAVIGNVHETGGNIAVDFANAKLPQELVRRMDVTDFATPVQFIDAENTPTGVHLVIHPSGQYEKLAYQSDDTFSVEFKPAAAAAAEAAGQPKEKYTGQKISLNFQSIDVRAVLSILADASGKNIVVSDSVNGNITLRLQDVPWDQAMDIILRTKGLATREFGNVLMVGTAQEVSTQENAEAAATQSAEIAAPLESAFIQVNYAKAADIQALLKGTGDNSIISKRGSVSVDIRTNTLLVQDTADNISNVRAMVSKLDVAVKQVLIESRIVIANNDFTRDLGARLGYTGFTQRGGTFLSTTGDATGTDTMTSSFASTGAVTLPGLTDRLNVNLPAAGASGQIAFSVLRGNSLIDLELSALQSEGQGEVVSSPHVMTADQQLAHIEQGVQIPYQQASSSGATTTAFKSAVLSLDVTPQITPDDRVIMALEVHNDSVGQVVGSATGNVPTIDTRDVKTNVLVNNGDTVVLGGIYETTETTSTAKVPLLGDLPLLGWLFRNTETVNNKDELLIFVTPKIVDQGATASVGE